MKRYVKNHTDIFAMSNVRGRYVTVEPNIEFSFYYSPKNTNHEIRVKPVFNRDRLSVDDVGTLKLTGDWEFKPGRSDKKVNSKDVEIMKQFFRKYLVLFCMVWDKQLPDPELGDYLTGRMDLHELIQQIKFYPDWDSELDSIVDVSQLEDFCYNHNLVNLRDNR